MSFYNDDELRAAGFAQVGRCVKVSRHARIYGAERISIGDHARIDDFCVLSAGAEGIGIGRHVHIAVMCTLIGNARIELSDFSGLSSRTSVYSSSDDYGGAALTNPTVPDRFRNVESAPVHLGRHVIVGAGAVILPGTHMEDGAVLGALSLAHGRLAGFTIYTGVPARKLRERSRELLAREAQLNAEESR